MVVYILVQDIDAVLLRVAKLGGVVVAEKVPEGNDFRACFADPDGNVFGLWEEG